MKSPSKQIIKGIIIITILLGLYAAFIERYIVVVNEYPVYVKNLPKDFDNFRILVIADLHYGTLVPMPWVKHVLQKTKTINKDIIVGVGDYVHKYNCGTELLEIYPHLNKLRAPHGVYLVNGNHDHWADNELSLELLEKSGFSVLDRFKRITKNNSSIVITGIGDYYEDDYRLDQTLHSASDNEIKIALAHNPDSADITHKSRIDLYITGHTHGGQVRVPFFQFAPILPVENQKYDFGVRYNSRGETVFISRGLGWAILPVRFNCFPEIAIVVLKQK